MTYRESPKAAPHGRDVEVRSFGDLTLAELAAVDLRQDGIGAFVIEATSFNPALVLAAGGHRLMVDASDVERADATLRRTELEADAPDDEPDGTIRCPRCEQPYCALSRMQPGALAPLPLLGVVAILAFPFWFMLPKRWRCATCGHAWDDPQAGPKRATPRDSSAAAPVFLRFEGRGLTFAAVAGIGALALETVVAILTEPEHEGAIWFLAPLAAAVVAGVVGSRSGNLVCSAPKCGAELDPDAESCARCRGEVCGQVRSRAEHFARAAEVCRARAEAPASPARKLKKKRRATELRPD